MLDYSHLPESVLSFISYKINIQNCSEKTAYEYACDLRGFFSYTMKKKKKLTCDDDYDFLSLTIDDVKDIKSEDIYEYLLYAASVLKNKPTSRARKLSAIKAFYKYICVKKKIMEDNPSKDIESPKVKQALPRFLSLNESRDLLECIATSKDKNKVRDYAIITLFLNCGMRLSELTGLSLQDISDDFSKVRVLGKGSKERMLYLNSACKDALNDYLVIRGSLACNDKTALWVSEQGKRMYNKSIQYTVKKYLKLAGLGDKHYSTHKLRHTAATLMYNTGKVDVRVLKDILGHEQLNTTQIYTHVSDSQMQNASEINPLSNITIKKRKDDE